MKNLFEVGIIIYAAVAAMSKSPIYIIILVVIVIFILNIPTDTRKRD